ncbi:MAG TPA: hypothetical protein VGK02_05150 [Candidatus Aquicultor sp.]|jgi:hypothetical protein
MLNVKKPGTYDFVLAAATVVILIALSLISVYGTIQSWINSVMNPLWTQTLLYPAYLQQMNGYAFPFAVALILVLCMCIPKRFVPRSYLVQSSLILLSISILTGFAWGFSTGLAFFLLISGVIQTIVLVLLIGKSDRLAFEREGFLVQLGSSLLHLGFVVFAIDLLVVKDMRNHLAVFWFSTGLITVGCVLSFYARELAAIAKRVFNNPAVDEELVQQEASAVYDTDT